jgi:hypothetical protein
MGLRGETPTVTLAGLQTFRSKARSSGCRRSPALIGLEWLQREATSEVRQLPKELPNSVRVVHEKTTRRTGFLCLTNTQGTALSRLMAERDAVRRGPESGRGTHGADWPKEDECDLTHYGKVKK